VTAVQGQLPGPAEVCGARRAAYGANPALGRHGTRARQEILDAARTLFAECGYHGTTVEAIGMAAGRSGAAVYQYFEGKAEIFGVFVDELTRDVLTQAGRLGELERVQPGPEGLAELRSRLGELAAVVNRHRTTFRLWPFAEHSEPALSGSAKTFMWRYVDALRPGLAAAGVPAAQEVPLALAMSAMLRWSHFTRAERAPHLDPGTLDDTLARVIYFLLFSLSPDAPKARAAGTLSQPPRAPRPAGARPLGDPGLVPGVRRRVTPRSRPTLDRITAAATTAFRRHGFHGTSILEVAKAAGVSHGSVYTYWPDRSALFTTLAHDAAVALADHIEAVPYGFAGAAEGRAWMRRWIELVAAHGAVLHMWTHEVVHDEELGPFAREMQQYVTTFLDWLLRAAPSAGLFDETAAHVVAWSLLTDVPFTHCEQLRVVSHEEFLDVLSMLLMRGLLGYR
jgi:AcrR family transcriptional regulator